MEVGSKTKFTHRCLKFGQIPAEADPMVTRILLLLVVLGNPVYALGGPPEALKEAFALLEGTQNGARGLKEAKEQDIPIEIGPVSRTDVTAVSYTHLTLPTIYSV